MVSDILPLHDTVSNHNHLFTHWPDVRDSVSCHILDNVFGHSCDNDFSFDVALKDFNFEYAYHSIHSVFHHDAVAVHAFGDVAPCYSIVDNAALMSEKYIYFDKST